MAMANAAGTDVAYRAYQITQTRDVHRRSFHTRTRSFRLRLDDAGDRQWALKLQQHFQTTPADTWTNVTVDGRPLENPTQTALPTQGLLAFTSHQTGTLGAATGKPKAA